MKNIRISTFSLRVKNRTEREYLELSTLAQNKGLLNLLKEYLKGLEKEAYPDTNNLCLLTASHIHKKACSISAFLERGEYGIESNLLNVNKKKITYQRSVDDAEMMPFYFLVAVPREGSRGIIAFHMEANTRINSHFKINFEDFLRKQCKECDLEIDRLVPKKLVRQYIRHGRVAKLRFMNLSVPNTIEDAFRMENTGEGAIIELQVKAKPGSTFLIADRIKEVLNGKRDSRGFVQIQGFDYDTVKVEFDVDGKHRTLDLSEQPNIRADYDVTDKVTRRGGHPTFASIDRAAREIVREIMRSLKMDTTGV